MKRSELLGRVWQGAGEIVDAAVEDGTIRIVS
jgi:hypothetical protein